MPHTPLAPLSARRSGEAGFSLVELAIVLIIIGIILGAVTKGRDLIRSSEQKKIYTQFVNAWAMAYQSYHERTGMILGDVDNVNNTGTRDGQVNASMVNMSSQLSNAGITPPAVQALGNNTSTSYQDASGAPVVVSVTFAYNNTMGNHLRITDSLNNRSIPSDLGMALDTLIDGRADGTAGEFVYVGNVTANAPTPAVWPNAVDGSGNPLPAQGGAGAIWRMPF